MKSRRGISLVELLMVMSAATVVLTMSAGLIHRIMHAQSMARAFADVERTSLRLANAFRRDVHEATGAEAVEADAGERVFLRLKLPGNQSIEYGRREANIVRVLLEGSRSVAREEFAFPAGIELAVRREESRLIVLTIHSRPGEMPVEGGNSEASAFAVPVNLQVQACVEAGEAMNRAISSCRSRRLARRKKRGAILIAALVCLAIVMTLLGSMLVSAIRTGRQLHAERDLRQCELLLAAGVDRAELRVAKEPGYRGETWKLPAAEIVGTGEGEATIEVALDAEQKPQQLSVIAEYPAGSERSIRRSRTIVLSSKTPSE